MNASSAAQFVPTCSRCSQGWLRYIRKIRHSSDAPGAIDFAKRFDVRPVTA